MLLWRGNRTVCFIFLIIGTKPEKLMGMKERYSNQTLQLKSSVANSDMILFLYYIK